MKQARVAPLGIPQRGVRSVCGRWAARPYIEEAAQPADGRRCAGCRAPEGERPRFGAFVHRLFVFLRSSVAAGRCRCAAGREFIVDSLLRLPCTAVFRSSASSSVRAEAPRLLDDEVAGKGHFRRATIAYSNRDLCVTRTRRRRVPVLSRTVGCGSTSSGKRPGWSSGCRLGLSTTTRGMTAGSVGVLLIASASILSGCERFGQPSVRPPPVFG